MGETRFCVEGMEIAWKEHEGKAPCTTLPKKDGVLRTEEARLAGAKRKAKSNALRSWDAIWKETPGKLRLKFEEVLSKEEFGLSHRISRNPTELLHGAAVSF